jgi:CheY-like chemotaxis protein
MSDHILVVDDDDDLRETVQMLLEEMGFSVTVAANGRVALERIHTGSHPNLILLDLMMPEMNGWQFLEHVRHDESLGSIPIVIMTAHRSRDPSGLPPEDFLHKPFDAPKLLASVALHLARATPSRKAQPG